MKGFMFRRSWGGGKGYASTVAGTGLWLREVLRMLQRI